MPETVLAIDIGNTTTQVGAFTNGRLAFSFRLASTHTRTVDEAALLLKQLLTDAGIKPSGLAGAVIASVVPVLTPVIEAAVTAVAGQRPYNVTHQSRLTVRLDVPHPEQIGADRIANAEGFWAEHKCAGIVVDFGTATTFDVITRDGAYIGGAISPGVETSGDRLSQKAAQLFKVAMTQPTSPVGHTTEDALRAGLYYGTIGAVDEIVARIMPLIDGSAKVIATGGLAPLVATGSKTIQTTDPMLTLKGLLAIFRTNQPRSS